MEISTDKSSFLSNPGCIKLNDTPFLEYRSRALCRIEGFAWIRILYCYPEEIYPELIETMSAEPKICHYLDLPVQHCDDQILRKMARRTTGDEIRAIVCTLRERILDIALRTTLIAGFPGETEEQHRSLVSFVRG